MDYLLIIYLFLEYDYGKSSYLFLGKSINEPCYIAMLVYWRVYTDLTVNCEL